MKKTLLLTVLLFTSFSSFGQFSLGKFSFGIKAGFTGASLTNAKMYKEITQPGISTPPEVNPGPLPLPEESLTHTYDFPSHMKVGTYFGVFVEYMVNERIALQSDVVYSEQGGFFNIKMARYNDDRSDVKDKTRFIINYLNIPVVFKYYLVKKKLSIDVGPQVGIRLDSEVKRKFKEYNITPTYAKVPLRTTPIDFSLVTGVTYYAGKHFDLHARFTVGLTHTLEDPYFDPALLNVATNLPLLEEISRNVANNVINLGLGYRF